MLRFIERGQSIKAPAYLIPIILLLATHGSCQVHVSVSLTKAEYLDGEPVEAIVKITNIGSVPVDEIGAGRVELDVEGQKKRPGPPNLWGCFAGEGEVPGAGIDHPPTLLPNSSTEFRYLLRDYHLPSGQYVLRISGRAGVEWEAHDPVPGADFDQSLALTLRPGTEKELRAAYEPYVAEASYGPRASRAGCDCRNGTALS